MEVYYIETVILGKIRFREKDDCRFSVRIQRVEEPEVSESQMFFNSDMKIKFSCLGSRPVLAVRDFVNTSLPRFSELERIKDYSLLMNQNSSLVIMTYTFRKKCLIKTEEFKCDIDALPEPDLSIAFWTESDRDFKEPTIELKIGPVITEVVSKNVSELSEELFLPFSDRAVASAIIMNLNSFNLTKTNRIVYSPQTNDFEAYFGSNVANSCMAVGGIQICDWTGSVKMFNYGQMESKCSLITITGKGKTAMDFKTIGDVRIDIDQDCKLEHKSNYRISIKIDKTMLKKLLESVVSNLRIDDQFMNVFNLKKLYETNILISERQSFNLAEFLSDRFPYVIKGSTNIPNTNYSVPFSLNIMANSFTGVDFQNLCMFLDKISTISLISRMTSLKEENLPAMLQDSSLCIQNLPNASSSKNAVLLSLPISILSKCMNSDLLCSFLNFVIGEKWRGMVLSGILQENTLNLKSPIVPEGKEFSRLNLTSCGVNYKLKMKQKIRVYMKCNLNLPEIELPVPIYFFPEFRKEKFLVYGFVHYKAQESSTFFGLEHFKYTHLHTKFLLKDIEFINFEVEVYYTELGLSTKTPAPTVFMEVNLVNQNYSQIHVRLPPLSIIEIGKIFGFGDCSDLSDLITDTLDEWDIKEFKLETLSGGPLIIKGLNLAHNTLFNSTLQIHKKLDDSKIILHALKPIILRIKSIEHQATLASYTNSKEGPTIVINMECACENRCKENRMGALVSTISVLNMKSSIKIDLTYSKPWTGLIVTNNFMNQKLKARLQIELSSLDTEIELTGTLLNEEKQIVNRIQGSILKKSKHVIDKVAFMEKELDNILLVLNKIRSEKIDTQLKLEESRKRLEQDTVTEIVYETSLNLTCREEYCERVCVGCASTLPCVSKDILGSCVSFSNWDTKCGCGRDHLCLLYNDACEEIIELSKSQLRIYDNTKVFQKMLYDSYHKKFQQISKDEAKIEMLYSSAMKITAKTMKEMKKKINEARAVFKDIPISKWLTVSDILIFSNPNITALDKKLQNQTNELCIYLQLTFNNRKNIVQTKYVNYCPSKHGTLIKFIISEISKELFPNIYNIDEDNSQFSNGKY
ncbi:hypothetical protein RF11_13664 [Thelohanellus kitauei]|uniref:Uncharacterized protein n=1 Tax=Thelohanellus kitauei TaxID=669202 RepID=A0A0C2MX57_THEKT|nr:hypothetical protein RF11_13664 [Thelohanellus kitauei]